MKKIIGTYHFQLDTEVLNRIEISIKGDFHTLIYPPPFGVGDKFDYNGKTYVIEEIIAKRGYDGVMYCFDLRLNTRDGLPANTYIDIEIYKEVSPIYVGPKQAKSVIVKQGGYCVNRKRFGSRRMGSLNKCGEVA